MDRVRENWIGYLFIVPTFVMFTILFYYPIVRGVFLTFTNTRLGEAGSFVGLENYSWLLTNDLFHFAFGWTLAFVFGTTLLQLVIGLVAALLLSELRSRWRDWTSAIIMSPYFSAPLAGGVIWMWFLNSDFGMLPMIISDFLGVQAPSFLADGIWPYVSLIVAQSWHDYGYAGIIYAAAIVGIPREQYEAAALAGAGRLRRFRDVTLPHLVTPTIIILALRTAWNVAEFAQPFELTGGGPGTRTMLMSILTYETAYVNLQFSRAYTLGMAMILVSMTAAIFYVTVIKDEEELYV
ncbi:binding-protein-dependent transport system inner membrane protein [Haloferax denitrificans ATCC 35960]|uniref:Binding-protein-dependent transport system inner membrane protein n=3 Tax=Haloferacaceae TaxID=1644056 RepID=M0II08_9EURY|nr:binding-protein-dependent transport system inner membrane protein [Haloferax sulfurifontis ATCC BAA-897]EMA06475.1 binding-protein-dependent transport system inner membrane protein [Haloferax denitrificans ATCC 35960]